MKKLLIAIVLGLSLIFIASYKSKAQVSVNINIGTPFYWNPIGYHEAYYYTSPTPVILYRKPLIKHVKYKSYTVRGPIIRNYNTSGKYVVGHHHEMPPGQAKKYYFSNSKGKYKSHGHKGGKKH